MIKKILFLLMLMFISNVFSTANAVEPKQVLNLHTNESYVIDFSARPKFIKNSNTQIVKAESITDIFSQDASLLITTFREGISYISFQLNNKEVTLKLLIDNNAQEDDSILKLDRPENKENNNK